MLHRRARRQDRDGRRRPRRSPPRPERPASGSLRGAANGRGRLRHWDARGGEVINGEIDARWAARPITEVRDEFRRVAGELRGFLTVVPETRWLKNADQQRFFYEETTEHYEEHAQDLAAILAAAADRG